jgi:signal transduction histidine kinase
MRRRLALLVSATMALVLFAFVVPLALLIRVIVADRAVADATVAVRSLSALVATAPQSSVPGLIATAGRPVTVFFPDGSTVGVHARRTPAVQLSQRGQSISVADPGGREILVAVRVQSGGTSVIRTFVSNAELGRGVTRAWIILAVLGVILLGLGVAIADQLVGTVTRPIGELAQVSRRLAGGELEARAGLAGPPEVREVAVSLNYLAGRIRDLIWQERESIADLSHRLRTPLTALRLEAEAVPESADPDRRIETQVQALETAVTSLIEDARRRSGGPGSCDAAQVIAERTAFWSVLADDQGRAMTVELGQAPVLVGAAGPDLAACLDALLGNVFAHTPEGTGFTVRLRARSGGGGVVTVDDTGPGFGGGDPVRRGASSGGSTGLGLDIARQTAEASGGSLTVGNSASGGRVVVELGPPQDGPPHHGLSQPGPSQPGASQPGASQPGAPQHRRGS